MKIEQVQFNLLQIAKSDYLLLVDILPVREFLDGQSTDKVIGYRYICVCPQNKFEKISIKVEESAPLLPPEELATAGNIKVAPIHFEGKFYKDRSGEYQFTAKAERLEVVK